MSDQLSVFDMIELTYEPEPAPAAAPTLAPKTSPEELAAALRGELPMRGNYVHLGWHKGGEPHIQTVFSLQTSQVKNEILMKQETVYVVPVPLPEAWLKDPALHPKAREFEAFQLMSLGFLIKRPGWEVLADHPETEQWKIGNCLCAGCGWLRDECKCEVKIV